MGTIIRVMRRAEPNLGSGTTLVIGISVVLRF